MAEKLLQLKQWLVQYVFHLRKSRLVLINIRGKSVADAISNLDIHTKQKLLETILKVFTSANAENNLVYQS